MTPIDNEERDRIAAEADRLGLHETAKAWRDSREPKHLPKARFVSFEWSWAHCYLARFRLANAVRLQIGWLGVLFRAPWLEQSARALHTPETINK